VKTMKKLTIILVALAILIMLSGCFVTPEPEPIEDPPVIVDPDIICEGGHYKIHWVEWSMCGCPGTWEKEGIYWENPDGRIFYIGILVEYIGGSTGTLLSIEKKYGVCPESYIEEIFL